MGCSDAHSASAVNLNIDSISSDDIGAKVNNAVFKLGKTFGTIYINSPGEIRTPIILGTGHTLIFGPGTWSCLASPCIIIDNAVQVSGSGIYRTKLILAQGGNGPLLRSKDYEKIIGLSEPDALARDNSLYGDRKALPGVKYIKIKDLTFDGKNIGKQVNGIELYGFWMSIEDVSIERFSGDGLVTQFIPGASVDPAGNDAMESYFTRVKLISNKGNGWTARGPHDAVVTGVIAANNVGWGIDVKHKEGYFSGGGMMLNNTHLYGNGGGLRTENGATIIASGFESEANKGVGLLLRSNDSIIQGSFYANGSYGIQFGDGVSFAGANVLNVQVHNNKVAQVYWQSSGGYNSLTGTIFPNDSNQKYFESRPTQHDQVLTAGPWAVQHLPGGITIDSSKNIYGAILK